MENASFKGNTLKRNTHQLLILGRDSVAQVSFIAQNVFKITAFLPLVKTTVIRCILYDMKASTCSVDSRLLNTSLLVPAFKYIGYKRTLIYENYSVRVI